MSEAKFNEYCIHGNWKCSYIKRHQMCKNLKEKAEKLEAVKTWWKKWHGCFVDLSTCIPEFVKIMGAEKAGKAVDDSGTQYAKEFRRQADTFDALAGLIEQEDIEVTSNFANLLVTRGLAEVCRGLAEMAEKGELEENLEADAHP